MKTKTTKQSEVGDKYETKPPDVVVVRLAKDVQVMMALAKKAGFAMSWPKIVNRAVRHRLQQEFQTKHVQNIQDKMRLAGISVS